MKKFLAVLAFSVAASGASFAQLPNLANGDCNADIIQVENYINSTPTLTKETIAQAVAFLEQARTASASGNTGACDAAVASAMGLLKM